MMMIPGRLTLPAAAQCAAFLLLAITGGCSVLFRIVGDSQAPTATQAGLVLFAALALGMVVVLPWRWLAMQLRARPRAESIAVVFTALLIGVLWLFILPVSPAPQQQTSISVQALGTHTVPSSGNEVWMRIEANGRPVEADELQRSGDWVKDGQFVRSTGSQLTNKVTWHGYAESGRLIFVAHSWSGHARVTLNSKTRVLDLYRAEGGGAEVLTFGGEAANSYTLPFAVRSGFKQWLVAVGDVLLGAFALSLAFMWLGTRPLLRAPGSPCGRPLWQDVLQFGSPLLLTGTCALLLFFPGPMTSDSLDQWHQAGTGHFVDAHPLLYSLVMVAARSFSAGPAAVAMLQLVLLAAACAWLIAALQRATSAPRWAAWLAAGIVALHPFVWLVSITLWKDVPYATCVVALVAFVVQHGLLSPTSRLRWRAVLVLALLMFGAMALRHNGPPVALACGLLLLGLLRGSRRRVLGASVLAIGLLLGLRGPVSDALDVQRSSLSYMLFAHHIGAHIAQGHQPAARADREILRRLNPSQPDWAYSCATVNPLIFNDRFNVREAQRQVDDLRRIWIELASARPDIEAGHGICGSGLIWRMRASDPLYLSSISIWAPQDRVRWITPLHDTDPIEASLAPRSAERIGRLLLSPGLEPLYQPAGYMYALILACGIGMLRTRNWRLSVVLLLPAVHTVFLAISIVAQDTRYQLPVILMALACTPLFLSSRRRSGSPSPPHPVAARGGD